MTATGGPPRRLRQRPTPDLVVMFLAGLIGLVIAMFTLTVLIVAVRSSEQPTDAEVNALRDVASTMLGAVIGYLGGRHLPRHDRGGDDDGEAKHP